jgi:hypothetical protein
MFSQNGEGNQAVGQPHTTPTASACVPAAFLTPRSSMRLWSVITALVNIVINRPPALARLPLCYQPQPMVYREVPLATRARGEYGHPRSARTGNELARAACTSRTWPLLPPSTPWSHLALYEPRFGYQATRGDHGGCHMFKLVTGFEQTAGSGLLFFCRLLNFRSSAGRGPCLWVACGTVGLCTLCLVCTVGP